MNYYTLNFINESEIYIEDLPSNNYVDKKDIDRKYYSVYFYKGKNGKWNSIVYLDSSESVPHRGRSEALIVRDNEILLDFKATEGFNTYSVPGGGWDKGEDHALSAIRETQEEILVNCKDPKYIGNYIRHCKEVKNWVKINNPRKYWWKDYFTEVYLCKYDGKYTGKIDIFDKDDMVKRIKWYKIRDVYNILNPIHQRAMDLYINGR